MSSGIVISGTLLYSYVGFKLILCLFYKDSKTSLINVHVYVYKSFSLILMFVWSLCRRKPECIEVIYTPVSPSVYEASAPNTTPKGSTYLINTMTLVSSVMHV